MRLYNFLVVFTLFLVATIFACHIWLIAQDRFHGIRFNSGHYKGIHSREVTKGSARISQWRITELRAIDSQRIYMHETTGYGDLTARQCCAVEAAAKNNPNRQVHLFVSRSELDDEQQQKLTNSSNPSPWLTVMQHYPNVEVIFYDEAEYFNDTTLETWYMENQWQDDQQEAHLSDYVRAVSLFRGGGLFLDIDAVLTLKPLNEPRWTNFFVVKSNDRITLQTTSSSKIFHLVHGHHLIDMLIFKLVEASNSPQTEPFEVALDASLARICNFERKGLLDPGHNQCLDVRLKEERDVFLPPLDTLLSRRSFSRLKENGGSINLQSLQQVVRTVVEAQEGVLMTWDAMAALLQQNKTFFESSGFSVSSKMVLSMLIADNCPITAAQEKIFF
ncbi:hypothetical protein GHT06_015550 [Daphnia sinensis]|uniref:Alpha-1,4-N-acetylglucosaminyltransferase n=1 Tax=Daphnia sinensis TaxID=1820382 RepID=A0AAD5L9T3_9CRUS|nr:hypothetical protein GHT06_015550 [Daphnia sinensis]